jgi:hypothetical protein
MHGAGGSQHGAGGSQHGAGGSMHGRGGSQHGGSSGHQLSGYKRVMEDRPWQQPSGAGNQLGRENIENTRLIDDESKHRVRGSARPYA